MALVYVAIALGLLLTAAAGVVRFCVSDPTAGSDPAAVFLSGEIFKTGLTFTLIAAAGAVIKTVAERFLDAERASRARAAEKERTRREIVREFASIYSGFYSLRKLWHSARSNRNSIYEDSGSAEYRVLIRSLLARSVELEGRFGALKIEAISHFGLRSGGYGTKAAGVLENGIRESSDPRETARLQLDLLGESYDDWRHALEQDRKIRPGELLWDTYEALLRFFESSA